MIVSIQNPATAWHTNAQFVLLPISGTDRVKKKKKKKKKKNNNNNINNINNKDEKKRKRNVGTVY